MGKFKNLENWLYGLDVLSVAIELGGARTQTGKEGQRGWEEPLIASSAEPKILKSEISCG
jgi:hypothetical protein